MSFQNYQLVVRRGPQEGQVFPLTGDALTLGRDPMSDIAIVDPEVSRQHARFTRWATGGYALQDLGSTNGTFIDGNRLGGEAVPLKPGQIVVVGSNVTLVYEMLPEQTATVIASREELGFGEPVVAPVADIAPSMPAYEEVAATDRLEQEAAADAAADAGATIIDHSFDQPAYPVFTSPEPEVKPEPMPISSFDDSWSTPSSAPVDKGMPVFEPSYSSAPPPPPPPPIGGDQADGGNRNRILIAVVVVLLLCCCCSLVTGGWFYGDALLSMFGF